MWLTPPVRSGQIERLLLVECFQHGTATGRSLPGTEGVYLQQGLPYAV